MHSTHSTWPVSFWIIAALTVVQLGLVLLNLWENRRFAISRLQRRPAPLKPRRVALFAPCKGHDVGLQENLRPLFEQDHPNYSLALIVQSANDAACGPIRRLMAQYPHVAAKMLIAGEARDEGQKVHNLRVATANLARDVEIIAFVDSDARPRRNWLRQIVERLERVEVGAVTGYRWFLPLRGTLLNYLSYGINSAVAAGLGPGGHHLIWGGSWAVRRDTFDALKLREAWRGTLSDDLVATRALHRAKLRIDFEPNCMLASPLDNDWRQTLAFLRRQYVIARFYMPKWWLIALVAATLPVLTFWGGLALTLSGAAAGAEWTWLPAALCAAFYATTLVRGHLRCELAKLYIPEHRMQLKGAFRFDVWTGPLVVLVNWLVIISSLFGSGLNWRGIRYRIQGGGQVRIMGRDDASSADADLSPDALPAAVRRPPRRNRQRAASSSSRAA